VRVTGDVPPITGGTLCRPRRPRTQGSGFFPRNDLFGRVRHPASNPFNDAHFIERGYSLQFKDKDRGRDLAQSLLKLRKQILTQWPDLIIINLHITHAGCLKQSSSYSLILKTLVMTVVLSLYHYLTSSSIDIRFSTMAAFICILCKLPKGTMVASSKDIRTAKKTLVVCRKNQKSSLRHIVGCNMYTVFQKNREPFVFFE